MSAFDSAERKGREAFAAGKPRTANPYGDARTDRGSVTWARAFWRSWNRGWDETEKISSRSPDLQR